MAEPALDTPLWRRIPRRWVRGFAIDSVIAQNALCAGRSPNQISRENGKRRVVVTANVRERDLGSFVADVQNAVREQVELPAGYWIDYGGTFEQLMTALVASLGFCSHGTECRTGAEMQRPLATVVIGGIISSTLLTLLVLPALYRLAYREVR